MQEIFTGIPRKEGGFELLLHNQIQFFFLFCYLVYFALSVDHPTRTTTESYQVFIEKLIACKFMI